MRVAEVLQWALLLAFLVAVPLVILAALGEPLGRLPAVAYVAAGGVVVFVLMVED